VSSSDSGARTDKIGLIAKIAARKDDAWSRRPRFWRPWRAPRMHAYIRPTGIRTGGARALRWEHVDCGDSVANPCRRVAIGTVLRGYQGRQIAPDPGPAPDGAPHLLDLLLVMAAP
jgi:integrase